MELSHNLQQLRHSCNHYSSTTQTKGTNLSSGTMDNKPQDFTYQMPEAKSVNPILKGGNILFCKYYLILYCIVLITAMHSRRASPFNEKMMGNLFSFFFFSANSSISYIELPTSEIIPPPHQYWLI